MLSDADNIGGIFILGMMYLASLPELSPVFSKKVRLKNVYFNGLCRLLAATSVCGAGLLFVFILCFLLNLEYISVLAMIGYIMFFGLSAAFLCCFLFYAVRTILYHFGEG